MLSPVPRRGALAFLGCLTLGACCWGLIAGCQPSSLASPPGAAAPPHPGDRLHAVCTTGMVADMVRHVGGDAVTVTQLMGPGVDPHLYKPLPDDVRQLHAADIIFYSGLHLEGKMAEIFSRLGQKKATCALAEGIPHDRLLQVSDTFYDPHVWFDVELWSGTADVVSAALSQVAPARASEFAGRAQAYRRELLELHAECRAELARIPEGRRVLVTAHDAFSYFGRAYGVDVRAIQGVSTETEASVQQINQLVAFIVERKLPAIFVESSVNERNVHALQEGCRAAGHTVHIGGQLYSDALGAEGTPAGTYVGMVRHNVGTLVEALLGSGTAHTGDRTAPLERN